MILLFKIWLIGSIISTIALFIGFIRTIITNKIPFVDVINNFPVFLTISSFVLSWPMAFINTGYAFGLIEWEEK